MANAVGFIKVRVNHTGSCDGFHYVAGQPVSLPENVLKAIGKNGYEEVEVKKQPEEKKPQEEKAPQKPQAKGGK